MSRHVKVLPQLGKIQAKTDSQEILGTDVEGRPPTRNPTVRRKNPLYAATPPTLNSPTQEISHISSRKNYPKHSTAHASLLLIFPNYGNGKRKSIPSSPLKFPISITPLTVFPLPPPPLPLSNHHPRYPPTSQQPRAKPPAQPPSKISFPIFQLPYSSRLRIYFQLQPYKPPPPFSHSQASKPPPWIPFAKALLPKYHPPNSYLIRAHPSIPVHSLTTLYKLFTSPINQNPSDQDSKSELIPHTARFPKAKFSDSKEGTEGAEPTVVARSRVVYIKARERKEKSEFVQGLWVNPQIDTDSTDLLLISPQTYMYV